MMITTLVEVAKSERVCLERKELEDDKILWSMLSLFMDYYLSSHRQRVYIICKYCSYPVELYPTDSCPRTSWTQFQYNSTSAWYSSSLLLLILRHIPKSCWLILRIMANINSLLTNIPKLDGDNYHDWKFAISMVLRQARCWDILTTVDSLPELDNAMALHSTFLLVFCRRSERKPWVCQIGFFSNTWRAPRGAHTLRKYWLLLRSSHPHLPKHAKTCGLLMTWV